jgi:hypothetical protein
LARPCAWPPPRSGGFGLTVASLLPAAAFLGVINPNLFAVAQTLAGPQAATRWMGVQNGIANMAGILCPIITGIVVDRTGHFVWGFAIYSRLRPDRPGGLGGHDISRGGPRVARNAGPGLSRVESFYDRST